MVRNSMEGIYTSKQIALAIFLGALLLAGVISTAPQVFVSADTATTTVTVGNAAPTVSSVSMNSGSNITLVENTSVLASTTLTVTDSNGCSEISSVTATFYRNDGMTDGTICTQDDNSCYTTTCTATTTGNTCTGGSDTSVQYDCVFTIWYVADPTDAGSAFASDIWSVAATSTDSSADTGTATNTTETIEVSSLLALDVTATIPYGTLSVGTDSGSTNQIATSTNTGNTPQDNEISGEDMCTDFPACAGDTMGEGEQKFATSTKTYASLDFTLTATTSPASIELDLAKPTATTTSVTDQTYWGINIPSGQAAGSYTGQNLFTAVAD